MTFRNDGQGESNILQNKFTAYLQTALKRKKNEYLNAQNLRLRYEHSLEDIDPRLSASRDLEEDLPYEFQIEDELLLQALSQLSDRERLVLIVHILEEIDFKTMAHRHNLSYKGISTSYYRIKEKIKKHMGGAGR